MGTDEFILQHTPERSPYINIRYFYTRGTTPPSWDCFFTFKWNGKGATPDIFSNGNGENQHWNSVHFYATGEMHQEKCKGVSLFLTLLADWAKNLLGNHLQQGTVNIRYRKLYISLLSDEEHTPLLFTFWIIYDLWHVHISSQWLMWLVFILTN